MKKDEMEVNADKNILIPQLGSHKQFALMEKPKQNLCSKLRRTSQIQLFWLYAWMWHAFEVGPAIPLLVGEFLIILWWHKLFVG